MAHHLHEWITRHDSEEKPLIPASTVLLVRDTAAGLETLLMRRNSTLSFAEGMWVFPGGRIDEADHPPAGPRRSRRAARAAAVRESKEEADLEIDEASLVHYSHWNPAGTGTEALLDLVLPGPRTGRVGHRPTRARSSSMRGGGRPRPSSAPTTAVSRSSPRPGCHSTTWPSSTSTDSLLAAVEARGPMMYATRMLSTPGGPAAVWEDDAAYHSGDADAPGRRHRLVMRDGAWLLERD